jgi:hypothetical protein
VGLDLSDHAGVAQLVEHRSCKADVRGSSPLSGLPDEDALRAAGYPLHEMTRDEAEQLRERLSREHPDRSSHVWLAREDPPGEWSVAKVRLPAGVKIDPLKATVEAKPKPREGDDPRQAIFRNIPPYGAV